MKNIALITGAYGGLGKCFANIHAKEGGDLVLVGRSQDKLDAQKKELQNRWTGEFYNRANDGTGSFYDCSKC